jgi:hypothetical protein
MTWRLERQGTYRNEIGALNLNHSPFDRRQPLSRLPRDVAALAAGGLEREKKNAPVEPQPVADTPSGAFNGPMAAALMRWKDE